MFKQVLKSSSSSALLFKNAQCLGMKSILSHQSRFYATAASKHIIPIKTEEEFENYLTTMKVPTIIDVYADWCGPCKMLSPILQSVIEDLRGHVQLVTINSDQSPELASALDVEALPTLIFVQPGPKFVYKHVGLADKANINTLVKKHLGVDFANVIKNTP
ncbi:hypothetical protein C9374_002428 [Naegleria lovaniensis]|uniref:Thioredoxin domain-containing protein n=1 Tax=Naegleria lovaniensis TaxID=51637 RepID=A0AA88GV30_NAELO|nr:uncharacterized protein C9374_002428 [Naegleria lovaniensis]KAG2386684.1 hypothetical protein C9374_002428 [Naegleria lovaniensis]